MIRLFLKSKIRTELLWKMSLSLLKIKSKTRNKNRVTQRKVRTIKMRIKSKSSKRAIKFIKSLSAVTLFILKM